MHEGPACEVFHAFDALRYALLTPRLFVKCDVRRSALMPVEQPMLHVLILDALILDAGVSGFSRLNRVVLGT